MTVLKWLWLAVVVVVLDQLSKVWASAALPFQEPQEVIPFFNLTLMHNYGAAFSFLAQAGGWQRWFFATLALSVSVAIIFWLRRLDAQRRWEAAALALILGGALGNVWDRLYFGYVVDFIDVYYGAYHWPAFNIADSAISVGAVLLAIDALFLQRKAKA